MSKTIRYSLSDTTLREFLLEYEHFHELVGANLGWYKGSLKTLVENTQRLVEIVQSRGFPVEDVVILYHQSEDHDYFDLYYDRPETEEEKTERLQALESQKEKKLKERLARWLKERDELIDLGILEDIRRQ